ncbi:hypothetical protein P5V15_015860 [Pogonomyrmex californicus]
MPYYNDVSYYYGGGAYANHSSLMTGTGRTPFHTPLSRFSPHLSTISESPLSHLHRFSPIAVRHARRVIDTADIDVSSPRILSHNGNSPRNRLRRDRPTIKIRSQALKDNPALREHNEKHEKSVGELLMEKFFIKDKKSDGDDNQQQIRLYHQVNLDRLEDSQEPEILQKRITRRFTRRRSSTDLQLDPEQLQREVAYAQVQAKVLDSLVAEEQAQIKNEARRGTLILRKGTMMRGSIIEHSYYTDNIESDTMTQEEEEAATARIRKIMRKTKKKKRSSLDSLSLTNKIDGQSNTFNEISIDSRIEKNDEVKPQIYKIEACNSVGDFSTIWVNTSSENEKHKFIIPKKFEIENKADVSLNDTDEAETKIVLAVQKPYIKDSSRNSVYLTMRKPIEKFNKNLEEVKDMKTDENQSILINSSVDIENNILKNNALGSLNEDLVEMNNKIQITSDNKNFKASKKTICKFKKIDFLAKKDIHSISNNNSCNKRDIDASTTKNDIREVNTKDLLSSKNKTTTNLIQSNDSDFILTNAPKNDLQKDLQGFEDTFIMNIKNDKSQKSKDKSQKHCNVINNTMKMFDCLERDSTIKVMESSTIQNFIISIGTDESAVKEDKPKISAMYENTSKRNDVETEVSDNTTQTSANSMMLTTNNTIYRLPKLSKINTDRNNAVEVPKLSLRETTEYLANSPKTDQDVVKTTTIALSEKKVNKTSTLAQVSSFNALQRTDDVDSNKSTFRIDVMRHNDAVKLRTKKMTLSKETNDKVLNNECSEKSKLMTDVNLTETLKNNVKKTDENLLHELSLKMTDSSTMEEKVTEVNASKEAKILKTNIKKINCIEVAKDSSINLFSSKSEMPKLNSTELRFPFKTDTLLKNTVNENVDVVDSPKVETDSSAFKVMKIEDDKSLSIFNKDTDARILKKNITVESSKLINNNAINFTLNNIPENSFISKKQSISIDKKAINKKDKDKFIEKRAESTKSLNIITEKEIKTDDNDNLQEENVLSRSASTESIDFWSEIKAPGSPETTRIKQQNEFFHGKINTSKIDEKINLMNSKCMWKEIDNKKNEIDVKNITAFESLTIESSDDIIEEEKVKKRISLKSLKMKKAEIAKQKSMKVTEIEKRIPTMQKMSKKKKNLSIVIDSTNKDTNSMAKKVSTQHNNCSTTTSVTSQMTIPVEIAIPIINIVEAPKLPEKSDNRKIDQEYEDPNTSTNELSPNPSLIRKISKWSNQNDLTSTDDVETPVASEETNLVNPNINLQSSKTMSVMKKTKSSIKRTPSEKNEKGLKDIHNNELTKTTNKQSILTTKVILEKQQAKFSPKTSPKSKNIPSQRPLDLIKMFYTTPSALLTATPRDLSKVRRANIKRRRHHSRTSSISSDSTGSTTSTATTESMDENGLTCIIKGLKYNQAVDWWSYGVLLYEMLTGQSPFSGCDEDELFWSICNERPFIPRYLSQEAIDILVCLLEKDSGKRILGHEIAVHVFFQHLSWDRLERRQLDPPFKPALDHTLDTKYFDTAFTTERPRLTPIPEQILTSMDQSVFRGFSYTNPNATD